MIKVLTREDALSDGADLWILPALGLSEWTQALNWPLNLQITRALHHAKPEVPPELRAILSENEMNFELKTPSEPLLIASEGLLPNRVTAVVDHDSFDPWLNASLKVWQGLKQPRMRIFLPAFAKWANVKAGCPTWASEGIEVVESAGVSN